MLVRPMPWRGVYALLYLWYCCRARVHRRFRARPALTTRGSRGYKLSLVLARVRMRGGRSIGRFSGCEAQVHTLLSIFTSYGVLPSLPGG